MSAAPPPGSPPPFIPIPPDIAAITAPILIGTLFNWCLYGVLAVQVYLYAYYFSDDKKSVKFLVYIVFLLESLQTAFTGADVFYWFAAGFGDLLRLQDPYLSPFDTPFMSSFISLIIQTFFCYRIWILKRSLWWLSLLIVSISIIQAVGGMVGGVQGHIHAKFSEAHRSITLVYLWLVGDAVADFCIAVTMTWLFTSSRKQEHLYSNHVLARLVRLSVETNVISASVAILSLIMFVAAPNKAYYFTPTAVIGKIYSNTLLVTFNNRISLRDTAQTRRIIMTTETITSQMGLENPGRVSTVSTAARPVALKRTSDHLKRDFEPNSDFEEPFFKASSLGAAERGEESVEENISMNAVSVRPRRLPPLPPSKDYFGLSTL